MKSLEMVLDPTHPKSSKPIDFVVRVHEFFNFES